MKCDDKVEEHMAFAHEGLFYAPSRHKVEKNRSGNGISVVEAMHQKIAKQTCHYL
tara:strand:- start:1446 stop:1610 length:165 start_codon:yes stop_codon:yes gene_type:complete